MVICLLGREMCWSEFKFVLQEIHVNRIYIYLFSFVSASYVVLLIKVILCVFEAALCLSVLSSSNDLKRYFIGQGCYLYTTTKLNNS